MTRTVAYHDFLSGANEPVYRISFDCQTVAEREAVRTAGLAVVVPGAFQPDTPPQAPGWCNAPPNCGLPPSEIAHSGQEPTQAGQVLAHAQHEAAISGAECNGTACLMTRGAND